jgi:hypothetical protein
MHAQIIWILSFMIINLVWEFSNDSSCSCCFWRFSYVVYIFWWCKFLSCLTTCWYIFFQVQIRVLHHEYWLFQERHWWPYSSIHSGIVKIHHHSFPCFVGFFVNWTRLYLGKDMVNCSQGWTWFKTNITFVLLWNWFV